MITVRNTGHGASKRGRFNGGPDQFGGWATARMSRRRFVVATDALNAAVRPVGSIQAHGGSPWICVIDRFVLS